MRILFVMAGLPGDAYHGGAVTCWGLILGLKELGHDVVVLSLYDVSTSNPYLEYRSDQERDIERLGIKLIYSEFEHNKLFSVQKKRNIFQKVLSLFNRLDVNEATRILPYMSLSNQVFEIMKGVKYDKIFCYHFEPLAALYPVREKVGTVIVGLGDLLHEPAYYRHKHIYKSNGLISKSIRKLSFLYLRHQQLRLTRELVRWPKLVGFFASHYARFSKGKFDESIRYFRTPIPEPLIEGVAKNKKFSILHIGELNTTATSLGLMEFIDSGYDLIFSKELKKKDVDIYFAGGGEISEKVKLFFQKPNVIHLGRVYPHNRLFISADILLVPINVPLGVRIRILTALSFGVVVVAHVANNAGIEELESGFNCVLYRDSVEMANEVSNLFFNKEYKEKLRNGARQTYERYFLPINAVGEVLSQV